MPKHGQHQRRKNWQADKKPAWAGEIPPHVIFLRWYTLATAGSAADERSKAFVGLGACSQQVGFSRV